jgi:hypothetical protein
VVGPSAPAARLRGAVILICLACLAGCAKPPRQAPRGEQRPQVSGKVTFDVSAIDHEGLIGTAGGAVAVSYEFCIPARAAQMAEVGRLDRSARCTAGSKGRIGCGDDEALCVGSTNQENWLGVLNAVAALPYVRRIDRSFAE